MTATAPTPARNVVASILTALGTDSPLKSILGATDTASKLYLGRAPQGVPLPYVVIGDSPTDELPTFSGKTARGEYRLHMWAGDTDLALELYENVYRVLHKRRLSIEGFHMLSGRLELVTSFADPTPSSGAQAVANYRWVTQFQA